VGEQYVDLRPPSKNGPYLRNNAVIPMSRNHVPTATQSLLVHMDRLVRSVPLNALSTTVSELYKALSNRGKDISNLLDANDQLLQAALSPENVNATLSLIDTSSTVLQTQLDEQAPLQIWTHNLNLLAQQLKKSDPDIRHLLATGPADLNTVSAFIQDNRTDLGATLANLVQIGNLLVAHLDGLTEVLELYPALAAGGPALVTNRQGNLGLVLDPNPKGTPPDCGDPAKGGEGYGGTVRRQPENLQPIAPNVSARCTAPVSSGTNIRGSAHVPGGDPIAISGGGVAYPRVATSNVTKKPVTFGTGLQHLPASLGDASWLALLTDSLR
jgi:phospholipid/cholesterol/gamma-HCH transport system substrate-binding protein